MAGTTSVKQIKTPPPRIPGDLSPTEFENLTYDLMVAKGMVNVVWRTPGADGGRDIEAESVQRDASDFLSSSKWYIECKKYAGSVDWPTIYPKLAYADAAKAEYLLLCTTSKFTPQAINNCNQWNKDNRFPKLRLWAGHDLITQLSQFPDLQYRYGLVAIPAGPGRSIVSIALALSKAVGSYYSKIVTSPHDTSDRMLRAAFALALLLQFRMEDIEANGGITLRPVQASDDLAIDANFIGSPQAVDEPALSAFCSYLCALTKTRITITYTGLATYSVTGYSSFSEILTRYHDVFSAIALWGDFEFTYSNLEILVKQR